MSNTPETAASQPASATEWGFIGIDPDRRALGILTQELNFDCAMDLPTVVDKSLTLVDGAALQTMLLNALRGRSCQAIIERPSATPKRGIASAYQSGAVLGSVVAVLQAMRIPVFFVSPSMWRGGLYLVAEKVTPAEKARELFRDTDPLQVRHLGHTNALLIAFWYLIHWHRARRLPESA